MFDKFLRGKERMGDVTLEGKTYKVIKITVYKNDDIEIDLLRNGVMAKAFYKSNMDRMEIKYNDNN